jgi:hypothetical protein
VQIKLRSDACAIYDTPIVIRIGETNRSLVLRYALLVDPQSGELETLDWLIDVDDRGRYLALLGNMQWLAPSKVMVCDLYVDKSEYTLGIPSDNAFACLKIPQGRLQFAITDKPRAALLIKPTWARSEGPPVEASLRDILHRGMADQQNNPKR